MTARRTTAVILAAGAGTRLGELGRRHSKAMLPIAGKPLIGWAIERLRAARVDRLVVVGHVSDGELATFVRAAGGDLVQQAERHGIGDALRLALPSVAAGLPYLACACDSLFDVADLEAMIDHGERNPGAAVAAVLDMGPQATASRSAVRLAGDRVAEIVEKPAPGSIPSGLVSMPLYWLPTSFARHLESPPASGEQYVSTALARFIAAGGTVLAHAVRQRLEITKPEDVASVEAALRSQGWS